MKSLFTYTLLIAVSFLAHAQTDSTSKNLLVRNYPEDFPERAFRFKPFMVAQSTLAGEVEFYSKKRPASYVIGAEATYNNENAGEEIFGGAIELDKRTYLFRSIAQSNDSELMFYLSYGAKFEHYQFETFRIESEYLGYDDFGNYLGYKETEIKDEGNFNKVAVNVKFGVHFLAFKTITIDTNLGAGIRYNAKSAPDDRNYYSSYTFDSILRKGIQPTMHIAIGLAN